MPVVTAFGGSGLRRYGIVDSLAVIPVSDEHIYHDGLGEGWNARSRRGIVYLDNVTMAHVGNRCLETDLRIMGSVSFNYIDTSGFDTYGYRSLDFWINIGVPSPYELSIETDKSYRRLRLDLGVKLRPDIWQKVSIPLEDLGIEDDKISFIKFITYTEGPFYIDELSFKSIRLPMTDVRSADGVSPARSMLRQNWPNPFNSETLIRFEVSEESETELLIYDIVGRKVRSLLRDMMKPGTYSVRWDGRDHLGNRVASGSYMCVLRSDVGSDVKKLILLR